jgi:uncharacterized LabA/DUF88 family protein
MANNISLRKASRAKQDEFYTQLADIEKEMRYYREQFRGKVVFCNCDDPYESNFFKYFAMNFKFLGLKKLITTCYTSSSIQGKQLSLLDVKGLTEQSGDNKRQYKVEITEVIDENMDKTIDLSDVEYLIKNSKNTLTLLKGDGDFRSDECIELLKRADIVATNPPFSLFREYVAQLIDNKKHFIIIGSLNAITYKEIFRLLRDNKIWLGNNNGYMEFIVPDYYQPHTTAGCREENGIKYRGMGNICWFTNLNHTKRQDVITLYKQYTPTEYPHYNNYDAINVNKVADIPLDWDGAMGVPITFLDKHNPRQFEIVGLGIATSGLEIGVRPYQPEHRKYRKEIQKRGVVDGDLYLIKNGIIEVPYARIIIKHLGGNQ